MSKYSDRIINLEDKNNSLIIIYDWVKPGSHILDVGCDEGYFSHLLKANKNCKVWGLEVNPEAALKAREVCEYVWENDLDWEEPFKDINEKFDYIVFADVLEHTKNPQHILKKAKKLLTPHGQILVSIPNIAHISARLELLNGSFEYEKTGIFDNTHLKYFTLKTFTDLVNEAGFKVNESTGVFRDIPHDITSKLLQNVGLEVTDKFMKHTEEFEMQAYQLLFRLSESSSAKVKTKPNPFKPMTVADDSVVYLRKKVLELEKDKQECKEQIMQQNEKLAELESKRRKVYRKLKAIVKKFKK